MTDENRPPTMKYGGDINLPSENLCGCCGTWPDTGSVTCYYCSVMGEHHNCVAHLHGNPKAYCPRQENKLRKLTRSVAREEKTLRIEWHRKGSRMVMGPLVAPAPYTGFFGIKYGMALGLPSIREVRRAWLIQVASRTTQRLRDGLNKLL